MMIKFTFLFLLFMIANGATAKSGNLLSGKKFTLTGKIDVADGYVRLVPYKFKTQNNLVDEKHDFVSRIVAGKFQIEGEISCSYFFKLQYFKNTSCKYESDFFVIEPTQQNGSFKLSDSTPKIYNKTMTQYYNSDIGQKFSRLKRDYRWLHNYSDSLNKAYAKSLPDSIKNVLKFLDKNYENRGNYLFSTMCSDLPESYFSLWKVHEKFTMYGYNNDVEELFLRFSDNIKKSALGMKVASELNGSNPVGNGKKFPNHLFMSLKSGHKEYLNINHKLTLIKFWSSGCGPCIEKVPQLKKLYTQFSKKGFEIISISYDKTDRIDVLKKLIKRLEIGWPEYLDENGLRAKELSYPGYVLLDSKGVIMDNRSNGKKIKRLLETALK
jgi:thiol-disulfide isomerase/thioredoxin